MANSKFPVQCYCGNDRIVVHVEKDELTGEFMVDGLRKAIAKELQSFGNKDDLSKMKIYKPDTKDEVVDLCAIVLSQAGKTFGSCDYEILSLKQQIDDGELARVQKLLEGQGINEMIIAEVVGANLTQGINNIAQLALMCRGREQQIHSSSRRRAAVDADCLINGPWMGVNYLSIASRRDGTPIMVKFFRSNEEFSTMKEIHPVVSLLVDAGFQFAGFNLHAPSDEVPTSGHGHGKVDARKGVATMQMYACSLLNGPPFTPEVIANGVLLLLTALEELHKHGWAHLDVKEGNVFVSHTGSWLLGDFDACRRLNDPIDITTVWCFTEEAGDVFGQPAEPVYDFEMLAGLVATQFTRFKSEEATYIDEHGRKAQPGGKEHVRMSNAWRNTQLRRFADSCDAAATLAARFEEKLHSFQVHSAASH